MRLIQPTAEHSLRLLQIVKSVMGDLGPGAARRLIAASQKYWLNTHWDWDSLEPLSFEAWHEQWHSDIPGPAVGPQLMAALVVLAIAEGRRDWQTFTRIQQLAQRLQIKGSALRYLWLWCLRADQLLALDVYWHGFIAQKYRFEYQRRGWSWLLEGTSTYLGWHRNPALCQKYQQLQFLPPHTFGYQFWQFCQQHHYSFPGEWHGLHEGLAFHDATHVLGGFDVSSEGELQAVALTVGYQRTGDPLASLIFIILQQHAGVQIGLLSPAQRGWLAQPTVADRFIQALVAGAQMTVDLSQTWEMWDVVDQPLETLRQRYNLHLKRDACSTSRYSTMSSNSI